MLPDGSSRLISVSTAASMAVVSAFSISIFFMTFDMDFLLGRGSFWTAPKGDGAGHIIGMRYFLADAWRFPVFNTALINPPDGTAIIYTDSLPLFALFAKLLRPFLGTDVNYFGAWYLCVYVLQGLGAAFAVRALGAKGVIPELAAAIIALSLPAFLNRFGHSSLCGHFLILFALAFHFHIVRQGVSPRLWAGLIIMTWLGLLVHGYLFFMVMAIFVATAWHVHIVEHGWGRRTIAAGAVCLGGAVCIMGISGYFMAYQPAGGFAKFSMNMLSPFVPQLSGWGLGVDYVIDATNGQYEGFNYLGIGILLLVLVAIVSERSKLREYLVRYQAILFMIGILALLSITHKAWIGNYRLPQFVSLGLGFAVSAWASCLIDRDRVMGRIRWIKRRRRAFVFGFLALALFVLIAAIALEASQIKEIFKTLDVIRHHVLSPFRSSGRFFWPVAYTIMVTSIAIVTIKLQRPAALMVVMVAAALQFQDAAEIRSRVATRAATVGTFVVPAEPWRMVIAKHDLLTVLPTIYCTKGYEYFQRTLDLLFHASASLVPVHAAYVARQPADKDCRKEARSLDGRALGKGELLVVLDTPVDGEYAAQKLMHFDRRCRRFKLGFACTENWQTLDNENLGMGFHPVSK